MSHSECPAPKGAREIVADLLGQFSYTTGVVEWPLQKMPNQSRPTLNVLPQADPGAAANDDVEESAPTDVDGRRRSLYLQHSR